MPMLKRRKIADVGPRSAHIAGLRYASFADPQELSGARFTLIAPRGGDPEAYACVDAAGGRFALTATCAANALALVAAGSHPSGSTAAALAAFDALGRELRVDAERAARFVLDGAVRKIAAAVTEAVRQYRLPDDVPLVALGGAGAALVPELARMLGREAVVPPHAEVLSAIGAAASLIRAEVVRSAGAGTGVADLAREAEVACIDAGAAPSTVTTETLVDTDTGVIRAVATGAVALEAGAADHREADERERAAAAAGALGLPPGTLEVVGGNEYYRVYSENGSGRVAVIDRYGTVALTEESAEVVTGDRDRFLAELRTTVTAASRHLAVATLLPRVTVVSGPRLFDLSAAGRVEDIISAATRALERGDEPAFGIIAR
jgi:hypothetical protein